MTELKRDVKVEFVGKRKMLLDGEPFDLPVLEDSVSVSRQHGRNVLTMSILVGEVHMDVRRPWALCPRCDMRFLGSERPGTTCPECNVPVLKIDYDNQESK